MFNSLYSFLDASSFAQKRTREIVLRMKSIIKTTALFRYCIISHIRELYVNLECGMNVLVFNTHIHTHKHYQN